MTRHIDTRPEHRDIRRKVIHRGFALLAIILSLSEMTAAGCAQSLPLIQKAETGAAQSDKDVRLLEPGKSIEREIAGGQAHYYHITLTSGQYLRVVVAHRGIDVGIAILAPDSRKVADLNNREYKHEPEPVSVVADASGNYTIEVRSLDKKAQAVHYEVKSEELRAATEQDRFSVAAQTAYSEGDRLRAQDESISQQRAIAKYEEAISLYRKVGDRRGEAYALHKIGRVCDSMGDKQKMLDYNNQALPLMKSVGDRRGEALALCGIGYAWDSMGEQQKAMDNYNQALTLMRKVGDRGWEAYALCGIGNIYNTIGERQKALDYYEQALLIYREAGDIKGLAGLLGLIGEVCKTLGETRRALDYYDRALPLMRAADDGRGEAFMLGGIGSIYHSSGDMQKALEYYEQSLTLYRKFGDLRGVAYTLDDIGWLYESLGENRKALSYYTEALPLMQQVRDRPGEGLTLFHLGSILHLLGDSEKALDYSRRALLVHRDAGYRRGESETLYQLALIERDRNNLVEARTHIESALDIIESLRSKVGSQESRASYLAQVQGYYWFCIDLLMQMHRGSPYEGHDRAALQINERARARSLIDLLVEARADIRHSVDPALLERERKLQQLITARTDGRIRLLNGEHTEQQERQATEEIESLISEHRKIEAKIRSANPHYAALTQRQTLAISEIQKLLDADTLLLEYALGDARSYLWAVTADSLKSFELEKRSVIEDEAMRVYESLTARTKKVPNETFAQREARIKTSDAKCNAAAARLSRVLLSPVASHLGKKRLVIVSDGALQYIPFAALPAPRASVVSGQLSVARSKTTDSPLIAEHEVVYLPSASTLDLLRSDREKRKSPEKTIAVFADPVFEATDIRVSHKSKSISNTARNENNNAEMEHGKSKAINDYLLRTRIIEPGQPLARLPYSRKEAMAIAALVPERRRKVLLDFDVNYSAATSEEIGQYRFVHFATHGVLDAEHPELSGILLSLVDKDGRPQENGILRLGEIYNLRLPVDMVSLSACETALGKRVKGEGLVGLARGFMYAGAPRVLASLWKVEEAATAELMKIFYEGALGSERLTPADALRRAQIQMRRKPNRRAPYYWSGFVLQGDWK